jgi:subtilisin family serine protease
MKIAILTTLIFLSIFTSWKGVSVTFLPSGVTAYRTDPELRESELVSASPSILPLFDERVLLLETPSIQLDEIKPRSMEYQYNGFESLVALGRMPEVGSSKASPEGSRTIIAILDTGIDKNHDELIGKVLMEVNFTESDTTNDVYGHGTHVAGIIAANDQNGTGISGLAPDSRLLNVKVADDRGRCSISALADGIVWAVDHGADVINISIELRETTRKLERAIEYAWTKGAVIVAAAGNTGSEKPTYPAYYSECIGVSAVKVDGILAPLSNYGKWVDVAAPGFNVYSTMPNNGYGYKHGTSVASAYVSGIAARLFAATGDINANNRQNDDVRQAIMAHFAQMTR